MATQSLSKQLRSGELSLGDIRPLLEKAGLWRPEYGSVKGERSEGRTTYDYSGMDLSPLDGYSFRGSRFDPSDGLHVNELVGPDDKVVADQRYKSEGGGMFGGSIGRMALGTFLGGGLAAGAGWLGGAGAGTGGATATLGETGLLSGMDLAADAGLMGANGIGGAATSFGTGGLGALSGMDLAADAGIMGGNSIGAAGAAATGAGESFSLANAFEGLTPPPGISTGGGLTGMSATTVPTFEQIVASSGLTAASAAPGVLDKMKAAWDALPLARKMQLGSLAGSALVGALAPGSNGTGAGGAGQAGAAGLQMNIANQLQGVGTQQLGNAATRQAQFDPQFQKIIDAAIASQQTNNARSEQVWQQYQNYLMPAQQRMAQQAADYSSPGRMNAAGAEAVAGVDAQFQRNREAQQRDLGRAGVSMSSGRGLTLDAAQRFQQAKASAGADRVARQGIEDRGIALTQNVAAQANPTAGLALNATQTGLNAGNTAAGTSATQQQTYNASLQPGLNALQGASSAAGGAGNTYNGLANVNLNQQQQTNAGYAGLGSLVGQLGSLYFQSDPKTKTKARGKISGKAARQSLENADVSRWKYKKGYGDEGEHIGRMAGKGDKKGPDGMRRIDVASEFGRHHAAIADISRDVKAMRKRLSLADAKGGR